MANTHSLLNNFDEPLYSPNFDLIKTALTYKQGVLNTNREALDKYYQDQVAEIDVLKSQDKDYANQRLSALTDMVNQYANQDMSNS